MFIFYIKDFDERWPIKLDTMREEFKRLKEKIMAHLVKLAWDHNFKNISSVVNKGDRPLPGRNSEMPWPSGFT